VNRFAVGVAMVARNQDDQRLVVHHFVAQVEVRLDAQEGHVEPTADKRFGEVRRIVAGDRDLNVLQFVAQHMPRTIAFSVKTVTNDDFQKAIATSIQDAVEKSGNKFLLITAGEETGVSIQVNQVEDLIAKKVDAIILSPMDGKAVVPVLKKAQAANIPVIVVDSSVEKGNEGLHISYVGTDNFNAGKTAGERMVKELGGKAPF
jgi:ABC-type sugar transport system substrate-binding protein